MKKPEIIKFCAFCNDQFIASKPVATYCCNSCRTKACVQRKRNEQVKADQEAKRLKDQDRLLQIADARRLKREQKAELKRVEKEKQAEKDRQEIIAKQNQEEQKASALAEQIRKDAEDQKKIKEKQEADEKQHLANKEALLEIKRDRKKQEDQLQMDIAKLKLGLVVAAAFGINSLIESSQNKTPTPTTTLHFEKLSLGKPMSLNSKSTALFVPKPLEMPKLGYMSLPGINWLPTGKTPQQYVNMTSKMKL
jgi:hypothetical protein